MRTLPPAWEWGIPLLGLLLVSAGLSLWLLKTLRMELSAARAQFMDGLSQLQDKLLQLGPKTEPSKAEAVLNRVREQGTEMQQQALDQVHRVIEGARAQSATVRQGLEDAIARFDNQTRRFAAALEQKLSGANLEALSRRAEEFNSLLAALEHRLELIHPGLDHLETSETHVQNQPEAAVTQEHNTEQNLRDQLRKTEEDLGRLRADLTLARQEAEGAKAKAKELEETVAMLVAEGEANRSMRSALEKEKLEALELARAQHARELAELQRQNEEALKPPRPQDDTGWPEIFLEGRPLAPWRVLIGDAARQEDLLAFDLECALKRFEVLCRQPQPAVREIADTLRQLSLLAHRFWGAHPGDFATNALRWRDEFNLLITGRSLPLAVQAIHPNAPFDTDFMICPQGSSGSRQYVKEPLSWVILDKSNPAAPKVLHHGLVLV
jgi:hypothetical protein